MINIKQQTNIQIPAWPSALPCVIKNLKEKRKENNKKKLNSFPIDLQ